MFFSAAICVLFGRNLVMFTVDICGGMVVVIDTASPIRIVTEATNIPPTTILYFVNIIYLMDRPVRGWCWIKLCCRWLLLWKWLTGCARKGLLLHLLWIRLIHLLRHLLLLILTN